MTTLAAPAGGDRNRATELDAVAWTWLSISTVIVGLRLYSRARITRNLWWDDWFIVITLTLVAIFTIMWTVLGSQGGCRHLYYLLPAQRVRSARINWISQSFSIMAVGTGKISVALFIHRVMGKSTWRKAFLNFTMASSFLFCGLGVILTYVQCRPITALWDPTVKANCWKPKIQSEFSMFVGAWMAFIDLFLALLPITIMWNLQMDWQRKLGICTLMGMGVFASVCAAIKTSKLPKLDARSDITWETVILYIWVANECNVIIIAASIPALRPLYLLMFRRDMFMTPKTYQPSVNRTLRNKIRATSTPLDDSTTAIGHPEGGAGWLGTLQDKHNSPGHGNIRQTIELEITSQKRSSSLEERSFPQLMLGGNAV